MRMGVRGQASSLRMGNITVSLELLSFGWWVLMGKAARRWTELAGTIRIITVGQDQAGTCRPERCSVYRLVHHGR
jgi:hypothetical protein